MNQSRVSSVSPGGRAMFRQPMDDETKLGRDETIFATWRRRPETCAGYKSIQRNDGAAKAHDRGPS